MLGGGVAFGTYGVKILFISSISSGFCIGEVSRYENPAGCSVYLKQCSYEFRVMSFHNINYWISSYMPTAAKLDLYRAQISSDRKAREHYI